MTSEITLFVNPTAGRGRGAHAAQPAASALRAAGFSVRTVLGQNADGRPRPRACRRRGRHRRPGGRRRRRHGLTSRSRPSPGPAPRSAWSPSAPATTSPAPSDCRCATRPPRAGWSPRRSRRARLRDIDLGRVGGTWFGTVLASGFDSRVNDRGNRMRWPRRPLQVRPRDARRTRRLQALPVPDHPGRRRGPGDRGDPGGRRQRVLVRRRHADLRGRGLDDGLFDVTVVGDCSRSDPAPGLPAGLPGHPSRPSQGHRAPGREGRAGRRRDHRLRRRGAARAAAADRASACRGAVRVAGP